MLYSCVRKVVIQKVLLVPGLSMETDQLSVPTPLRAGLTVPFDKDNVLIKNGNVVWGTASANSLCKGLYYLEEYQRAGKYTLGLQCVDRQPFLIWHYRLGHFNSRTIISMVDKVIGIEIGDPITKPGESNIACTDCLCGSHLQIISRYPFTSATRKLSRVSADITGPNRVPDRLWGYRFLLVIIYHFTRYP